ncbi:hypothetical protein HNY73_008854 [Argiope bruennichi]|uniref:Uncharacterized protein n=1 Tax=Argiope bruennichi TaxID=94029 RepID=A0A8T0FA06_ARGBR|nr:hypothetical protein HNY73_008854 [Argiope bruennichi]
MMASGKEGCFGRAPWAIPEVFTHDLGPAEEKVGADPATYLRKFRSTNIGSENNRLPSFLPPRQEMGHRCVTFTFPTLQTQRHEPNPSHLALFAP